MAGIRYLALQRLGIDPSADQKQYFRKAIYAHTTGGEIAPHERNRASRRQAEATGKALPVEKRTGADGKARKQPAKKKRKPGTTYLLEGVDGRNTPQRVSGKLFRAAGPLMKAQAAAMDMPTEAEAEDESRVAEPDEIKSNFLDTIDRHAAVVRAYKKVFAVAALNQAQKNEISAAIRKLITQWTSLDRTFAAPVENAPPPDVGAHNMKAKMAALDDDLDIPESLRRQGKGLNALGKPDLSEL
jgi:hypothetical protein